MACDGLIVEVHSPNVPSWIGVFAFDFAPGAIRASLIPLSKPGLFCVVAGGSGYVVSADRPELVRRIPSFPITEVAQSQNGSVWVFADFTGLTLIDRSGDMWTSPRLSWDGVKIHHVSNEIVTGVAWNAADNREVTFEIDVQGRRVRTGLAFPADLDGGSRN
jgi:hypothetical protein